MSSIKLKYFQKYLISYFILLAGFIISSYGQGPTYFGHITTDDGLSQSDINAIYQDSQGFMWFGTHDGLNKYDGYEFTVYKPNANQNGTINSNLIWAIDGDKQGNLWIGTTGSGLNYFDRSTEKFTHYRNDKNDKKSLSSDYILDLFLDSKSRLWIATRDGLNMLDLNESKDQLEFQHFRFEGEATSNWFSKAVATVFEDSRQNIWVGGTMGGLYKLSKGQNGEDYLKLANQMIGLPLNLPVKAIAEDAYGRLLIATSNGLYCQTSKKKIEVQRLTNGSFLNLQLDNNNNVWAGSSSGLYYLENTSQNQLPNVVNKFKYSPRNPNSLSKDVVQSLFMDFTGIIWIGTNGGGINKYDPDRKNFRHIRKTPDPKSLSYDKIRSIFEDSNGTLWVGTEGGGLNMLTKKNDDGEYNSFETFRSVSRAFAITESNAGGKKKLLVGTENGLLYQLDISNPDKVKEENIVSINIFNSVFAILEDGRKNLWIGTYGAGVERWILKPDSNEYIKKSFENNPLDSSSVAGNIIRSIYEDSKRNIWFATDKGLSKLSLEESLKDKPKFVNYRNLPDNKESLSHNYILTIFESTAGDIWVGTFGGGLNKFIPGNDIGEEKFVSYSEAEGLPNNVIKGILEDDNGKLWLSTNRGLSRFDPNEKIFKNYDVNDGLQNNEFQELACLKRRNGEMLFGGVNGFNTFFADDIEDNTYKSETVITSFDVLNENIRIGEEVNGRIILNKPLNDTKEIELKHWQNNFSFEFAALHYASPLKNQFAYMLEGFDKEWITTTSTRRFASYTNLGSGDYTFMVKTTNNDGYWDETPSEINITVIPPFWSTKLAYLVYTLIIAGLLFAFRRFTIIRTTEKHQLLLEHLEKEKSEEMQRVKLEFFTNISHEFRTPLTLIKGPLEHLQNKGAKMEEKKVQEQYAIMHKNTNYLLRLVNQLLDFRKINQGKMRLVVRNSNIIDFIKEVAEPFQFLAHKSSIDFKINVEDKFLHSWFDHDALEKILNNLLSNAFKFTPKNGNVTIDISKQSKVGKTSNLDAFPIDFDCVVINVKDSGIGIKKDKIKHVFERFYIDKRKREINPKGAGIGLSFIKNLIELHQGNIQVESEINKGTSFTVKLPSEKEAYIDKPEIVCKEFTDSDFHARTSEIESFAIDLNDEIVDQGLSKSRSKAPIVLVVDDSADIRTFIRHGLEDDYTIFEAENGKDALDVTLKVMPNIILSDIMMPVMDGIEFCEKVKTNEKISHIPVILLTAKSSEETELKGLKTGADDYLTKPFNMELLSLKLANLITYRDELRKRFNREITLQPSEITVTSIDEKFLMQAIEIVEDHMMDTSFSVEMLVKKMGLSRSNLYLKLKELTGLSSSEFIRNIRLKRAVQLFEQSDFSVKEIMYMTGFNTASYFAKCFKKQFGVIPSEYVRGKKSEKKIHQI